MKYFSIILLSIILFFGCKPAHRDNEITKIELAKSGSLIETNNGSLNPGTAISIDSSLTYHYYGQLKPFDRHYFIGKISPEFWDTLNKKLERIQYKTLDTTDNKLVEGGVYYEIIISFKNGRKHITRYRDIKVDSALAVFNWINDSYKNVDLQKVKTPIKFETTFQNPPSAKNTVKFPPPIKHQKY